MEKIERWHTPVAGEIDHQSAQPIHPIGISVAPQHWNFRLNKPCIACPNRDVILLLMTDIERRHLAQLIYNDTPMTVIGGNTGKGREDKEDKVSSSISAIDTRTGKSIWKRISMKVLKLQTNENFDIEYVPNMPDEEIPTKTVKEVFDNYKRG